MHGSTKASGIVAKCAPLNGCALTFHTLRLLRVRDKPRSCVTPFPWLALCPVVSEPGPRAGRFPFSPRRRLRASARDDARLHVRGILHPGRFVILQTEPVIALIHFLQHRHGHRLRNGIGVVKVPFLLRE